MEEKRTRSKNFFRKANLIIDHYKKQYNEQPSDCFTSPGRIEILGNHTDHNNGLVMVSSIDLSIMAVTSKNDSSYVCYASDEFPPIKVDINDLTLKEEEKGNSISLIKGILFRMKELGYQIGGVNIYAISTIFRGAGISSSAAFEVLIAKILSYYYNQDAIKRVELAKIGQYAESVYFGKPCGLLDQTGIALGAINYIDFKNPDRPYIKRLMSPVKNYDLILVNTLGSHSKLTPLFAKIREDMSSLSSYFGKSVLREVGGRDFFAKENELKEKYSNDVFLRGKHYFDENNRVRKALIACEEEDEQTFLKCINESGLSSYYQLKNCYVENEQENLPRALLMTQEFLNGDGACRLNGGGFAGTMSCFCPKSRTEEYIKLMTEQFGPSNVKKIVLTKYGTRYVCSVDSIVNDEEMQNEVKGERK